MKGEMMMSFLNTSFVCNLKMKHKKTSLQSCPEKVKDTSRYVKFLRSKRMSSFLFSSQEGSMTVEAAAAIPVFLFAILNLLSIILMFGEYSTNLADMHQRAKMLSVHAHVQEAGQNVNNDLIIQTKVINLEPIVPVMGFGTKRTIVNCRMRKWTGYDVTGAVTEEEGEEWVYITPYGESYHRSRDCRYLSLKIKAATTDEISSYRNKSGEIYYPCGTCNDGRQTGICFYTDYGNRYHMMPNCSALKRTIRTVRLSEVGNRHACSYCGGNG